MDEMKEKKQRRKKEDEEGERNRTSVRCVGKTAHFKSELNENGL